MCCFNTLALTKVPVNRFLRRGGGNTKRKIQLAITIYQKQLEVNCHITVLTTVTPGLQKKKKTQSVDS